LLKKSAPAIKVREFVMSEAKNEKLTDNSANDDCLHDAMEQADPQQLVELVDKISSQESLRQASKMQPQERDKFISALPPESAAELIEEAPAEFAVTIMKNLDSGVAAKIMEELQTDTQADIIQDLSPTNAEAILAEMEDDAAEEVRKLSQYADDTAGGLMELKAFSFRDTDTVATVLQKILEQDNEFERHHGQHPYIIDENNKLVGVISLRGIIRAKRSQILGDIMQPAISVSPDTDQETIALLFDEHPFLGIPVVDENGLILGIVSRIELSYAELERVKHEGMSRQRVGDELRSMPTWLRSKRRLVWLSSNIVLNIIAASVISSYEETLVAVIAIAVFLPMVSDMSGCSGNQAVGVSMRELALGLTKPRDLFYVLKKELGVGIINGIALGIIIGAVAWIWKGNMYLGLVIGLALSMNTILAVAIGGTVPLILKRFKIDPAVAAGPLLTTVTDMAGFFFVLSLATFFMPQLLA
jgi:magnesium transporter